MDRFESLDLAESEFERFLRRVGDDQWSLPTPCTEWDVRAVANHVVAAGNFFNALVEGCSKEEGAELLVAPDVLQPDPVSAFVAQRPRFRAVFTAPGALDRVGHHVVADMTGAQLLSGRVIDLALHAWDIADATGQDDQLDPRLVDVALKIYRSFGPALVANGHAAPSLEVDPDASDQARLVALSGRRRVSSGRRASTGPS
jgi:uncharacterized protein (TIGR03086 family)